MTWTCDTPTVAGWYWWQDLPSYSKRVVEVRLQPEGLEDAGLPFVKTGNDEDDEWVSDMSGQWSGPLEPPTDEGL